MAERYSRLFSPEKNLYSPGAPVLIAAGALLRDSYTANLLAQLKFKNISSDAVASIKVSVSMLDGAGRPIGEAVEYQYLDINAARDEEFGRGTAIILPAPSVRAFTASVYEVCFTDGSVWRSGGEAWAALKSQRTLGEAYGDEELANQYRVRYGKDCLHEPLEDGGLWFCTCGAVNRADEKNCHRCRRALAAQKAVNISTLRSECALRLKNEQARQAEEDKLARHKKKKRIRLAAVIAPLLALSLLLLATVPGLVKQQRAYENAAALLAQHSYDESLSAFTALGDYRDSAEQAEKNIPYEKAVYIMEHASEKDALALSLAGLGRAAADSGAEIALYKAAAAQFAALGGYKDSADRISQCEDAIERRIQADIQTAYDEASKLLEQENYCLAREVFLSLGDFADSRDMAREAIYRKAEALFGFMEKYDVRGIYAEISLSADSSSVFFLEESAALKLGSDSIAALRAACGEDRADIQLGDSAPEKLLPFSDALSALFSSLDSYSGSQGYIEKISEAADYTREFFALCREGDLYGAWDWLSAYEDEFENRDYYLQLLELYKPFCDNWALYSGDSTLISLTAGKAQPCLSFSTRVILDGETAVLRFSVSGGEEYSLDFTAELGETVFSNSDDGVHNYLAAISVVDHLAYMKYDSSGLRSSCEYERAD